MKIVFKIFLTKLYNYIILKQILNFIFFEKRCIKFVLVIFGLGAMYPLHPSPWPADGYQAKGRDTKFVFDKIKLNRIIDCDNCMLCNMVMQVAIISVWVL